MVLKLDMSSTCAEIVQVLGTPALHRFATEAQECLQSSGPRPTSETSFPLAE